MTTNNSEFIKLGDRIISKPEGLDYSLILEKVYNLKFDRYDGVSFLEEDGGLNMPKKVYLTDEDSSFINRTVKYYNNSDKPSTGIMLSGVKGTGKTVMAKIIAKESKLPIIVVDENYPTSRINDFFKQFQTPVAVIFDEVDKHWDTESLLGWLDGVQVNAKKLVLFTCNNEDRISEYLKNRCSRIRYTRHFEANDNARFLKDIIKDKGITDIEETYTFIINNFALLSIDNINSFLDEKILFNELSNEDVLNDMNIQPKGERIIIPKDTVVKEDDCEEDDYKENNYEV